jgi:putative SOS response-associated peptidase YedK
MCGRTRSTVRPSQIRNILNNVLSEREREPVVDMSRDDDVIDLTGDDECVVNNAENLCPGMCMYVAYLDAEQNVRVDMMIWGIKMNKMSLFNTRSEELTAKPMFWKMMSQNRGVVLVDGYYEWMSNGKGKPKIKYLISPENSQYFVLPVIFNNKGSFTILTRDPVTKSIRDIHERQPVILSNTQIQNWVNQDNTKDAMTIYENMRNTDMMCNACKVIMIV